MRYRGPVLGELSLTAYLWSGDTLAEVASYADNDEIAKAADSLDTNGFYFVRGLTGLFGQGVYIFRHGGWEFAISYMGGRQGNYHGSYEITVTSPTGEVYHLYGPSVGGCEKG